ncbi:MAG TPA: hypothetical protein VHV47_03195, partial [Opitutaceae bacterium]|nr:hypothetical protein [Opitutaceae bacterium]
DPSGQFSGRNLLYRAGPFGDAADEAGLERARARLLALRDRRDGLVRDRRAAADAQGLLLAALAQASVDLHEPHYLAAARGLADAIKSRLFVPGGVRHFAGGEGSGSPADLAALAYGFHGLLGAVRDRAPYAAIRGSLLAECQARFFDPRAEDYAAAGIAPAPGVFVQAPAWLLADNGPAPEALALLAAADYAPALRRGLVRRLAAGDPATGDVLLALEADAGRDGMIRD